jgi:hypothetical protein
MAAAVPASARRATAATASLSRVRPGPAGLRRGVALQGMPDPTLHLGQPRVAGVRWRISTARRCAGIVASLVASLVAQPFHRVDRPSPSSGDQLIQNAFRAWWSRVQTVPSGTS